MGRLIKQGNASSKRKLDRGTRAEKNDEQTKTDSSGSGACTVSFNLVTAHNKPLLKNPKGAKKKAELGSRGRRRSYREDNKEMGMLEEEGRQKQKD